MWDTKVPIFHEVINLIGGKKFVFVGHCYGFVEWSGKVLFE